jgi:hypothetical protein
MFETPERRTEILQTRLTKSEVEQLDLAAGLAGQGRSDFLRFALGAYLSAQLSEGRKPAASSGSQVSGSKKRPASSTAKVKAAAKTSPSKRQSRTQSSH